MSESPHHTIRGVGARIRELRALRAYSLRQLAQRAHVSAAMLSRVERGLRAPGEQVMAAVARALSVSVTALHGQPYIEQLRQDRLDRAKLRAPERLRAFARWSGVQRTFGYLVQALVLPGRQHQDLDGA